MVAISPTSAQVFVFGGILALALIISDFSRRIKQSEIIGLVLAGLLLGPNGLGILTPSEIILFIGELGLLMLLFTAGLETSIKEIVKIGMVPFILAVGGVVFVFLLVIPFMLILTGNILLSLFMAAAASATSVGITIKILADYGKSSSTEAQSIVMAAIIDDIIALFLLIFISELLVEKELTVTRFFELLWSLMGYFLTMIGLSVIVSTYLIKFVLRLRARGSIILFSLSLAILSAYSAASVGLSPIVGAYIAGVILSDTHIRDEIISSVSPITIVTVPIFFLSVGMAIDLNALYETLLIGLTFTIIAIISKVLGGVMTRFSSKDELSWRKSLILGFGMVPRGEVGLIFASIGIALGILDPFWYAVLITTVLITTFITPLAISLLIYMGDEEIG